MLLQRDTLLRILMPLLACGGIIVVVGGVIIPTMRTITAMSHIISQEERDLALRAAAGETIKTTRAILATVRAALPTLEATLIDPNGQIELIRRLETLARGHRVTATLTLVQDQNATTTLPFTLNVSGSFEAVTRYLTAFEKLPWYISIDSLDIKKSPILDQRLDATLIVTGYLNKLLPTPIPLPTPTL